MSIDHWMMFATFKEQRHFIYPTKDTYDGVVLNANMVAHAPDGLAAFLLEKTAGLKYLIDPMTHAFQHDPSALMTRPKDGEPEVKASIKTLANSYGEPILPNVGSRPIVPEDLANEKILNGFTDRCVAFQESSLSKAMKKNDAFKYFPDLSDDQLKPYAIVAPYFYMSETSLSKWLERNTAMAKRTVEQNPGRKVFCSVVVSQGVILDPECTSDIGQKFADVGVDGFLIWVDGLNEQEAGGAELRGVLTLARELRRPDNSREVINLHGGYFSILAAGALGGGAFSGVTHGPEFGEHRAVVPVGGGIPIARYYMPTLHARMRYRDALGLLTAKKWLASTEVFHREVCDCEECRSTIGGDPGNFTSFGKANVREVRRGNGIVRMEFPTSETQVHCLQHYLHRKRIEYQFASTASESLLLDDLDEGTEKLKKVVGIDGVSHLEIWRKVLTAKRH